MHKLISITAAVAMVLFASQAMAQCSGCGGGQVYGTPAYSQPAYGQPVYSQPVYSQPVYNQSFTSAPVYSPPVYSQPAQSGCSSCGTAVSYATPATYSAPISYAQNYNCCAQKTNCCAQTTNCCAQTTNCCARTTNCCAQTNCGQQSTCCSQPMNYSNGCGTCNGAVMSPTLMPDSVPSTPVEGNLVEPKSSGETVVPEAAQAPPEPEEDK